MFCIVNENSFINYVQNVLYNLTNQLNFALCMQYYKGARCTNTNMNIQHMCNLYENVHYAQYYPIQQCDLFLSPSKLC